MLHNLGLSRNKLRAIFESPYVQGLDDDEMDKLFGKKKVKGDVPYDFLKPMDDRYSLSSRGFYHDSPSLPKAAFETMSAAPLYEFGKISISHDKRVKIFNLLPEEIRKMFPEDFSPGLYLDGLGRAYKYEDELDLFDSGVWSVAVPRSMSDDESPFPQATDILALFKKNTKSKARISHNFEVVDIAFTDPRSRKNTTLILLRHLPKA